MKNVCKIKRVFVFFFCVHNDKFLAFTGNLSFLLLKRWANFQSEKKIAVSESSLDSKWKSSPNRVNMAQCLLFFHINVRRDCWPCSRGICSAQQDGTIIRLKDVCANISIIKHLNKCTRVCTPHPNPFLLPNKPQRMPVSDDKMQLFSVWDLLYGYTANRNTAIDCSRNSCNEEGEEESEKCECQMCELHSRQAAWTWICQPFLVIVFWVWHKFTCHTVFLMTSCHFWCSAWQQNYFFFHADIIWT